MFTHCRNLGFYFVNLHRLSLSVVWTKIFFSLFISWEDCRFDASWIFFVEGGLLLSLCPGSSPEPSYLYHSSLFIFLSWMFLSCYENFLHFLLSERFLTLQPLIYWVEDELFDERDPYVDVIFYSVLAWCCEVAIWAFFRLWCWYVRVSRVVRRRVVLVGLFFVSLSCCWWFYSCGCENLS